VSSVLRETKGLAPSSLHTEKEKRCSHCHLWRDLDNRKAHTDLEVTSVAKNIYKANESRERIKQIIDSDDWEKDKRVKQAQAAAVRRSQAAAPLLEAYSEIEDQYLLVSVLKALWPLDFEKRDDAFRNLLRGYVYDHGLICGIRLQTPTGNMTFEAELGPKNEKVYVFSYDSNSFRPTIQRLSNREDWLRIFFTQAAKLIEPIL
jgi:hypothetical protein